MPVISLDIAVDEVELQSVYALYDRIQVWRSKTGSAGAYEEITAASALAATIAGSVVGPYNISGQSLILALNNADPLTITFTGTNPLTLPQVIQFINTAVPNLGSELPVGTGKLRLISPVIGTASSILASGAATATLGLPTTKVNGFGARPALTSTTLLYRFYDFDGLDSYWYKTRFYNSTTGAVSSFSEPEQGNPQTVLQANQLSSALLFLADVNGRPVVGRRVIFVPQTPIQLPAVSPQTVGYGVLPGCDRIVAVTDQRGFAEAFLVRGMTVRVHIEGSSYHRTIVVPNIDTFDLLQLMSTQPDPFSIVQAPPQPIRNS